jgi:RNA polymerase sigma-70 factor, ECF subfamily
MEAQNYGAARLPTESTLTLPPDEDHELLGRHLSSHAGQLYRTAFRVLRSHEEAEDAVQDGLLAAIKNLKSFQGRAQFSTWLTRVVMNAALMRLRTIRARSVTSIDQEPADKTGLTLAAQIPDPHSNPEEVCAQAERLQILKQSFAHLPASYRAVLWLRDVEGMTTLEAAEALRVSEATLKSRLHRARLEITKHMHHAACHHTPALTPTASRRPTKGSTACANSRTK